MLFTGDIVELLGGCKTLTGDWEPGDIACFASFLSAAAKLEFCSPETDELIGPALDVCAIPTCKPRIRISLWINTLQPMICIMLNI